ncbi:MAG: hypothetical protein IJD35_08380 [Clostridia bacterium]|nr:hypothetical protein [Clostridia bacterium]
MKSDDLFDAIGNVDSDMILNAKSSQTKKTFYKKTAWISAIAAMLVLSLIIGSFLLPVRQTPYSAYALAEAEYPNGISSQEFQMVFRQSDIEINSFIKKTLEVFFQNSQNENRIISPLNLFMALSMLAEITEGETRAEILDLLDVENIETLREQASTLWRGNYSDDGVITSVLASSVWLRNDMSYQEETIKRLADIYYASSFSGEMGSDNYNEMLQDWLNKETGGLLNESISNIETDSNTVILLATTVLFQAKWGNEFSKSETTKGVFYAPNQEIKCNFMNESGYDTYYWSETFSAVKKELSAEYANCGMWFILPDEGIRAEDLFSNENALQFILSNGDWENNKYLKVNLSVPKFDVSSDIDLKETMQNLGVNLAFNSRESDFSALTEETLPIEVSSIDHSVRVTIDEEGCTAATMTTVPTAGCPAPLDEEIDFVLDRPFLFVITSDVGLPLFVGTVNQPK